MKKQVCFRKSVMSLAIALLIAILATSAVSFFIFPATAVCQEVSVPMTFEHWNKLHTGNWEETAEGLRIYGTAYRKGTSILSETIYNFRDSESFIKWKAHSISYANFLITLHNDILWGAPYDSSFMGRFNRHIK